jgi:sorting nexin-29
MTYNCSLSYLIKTINETAKTLRMQKQYTLKNVSTFNQKNIWFNSSCIKMKKELSKSARKLKKNNLSHELYENYKTLRRNYFKLIEFTKKVHETDIKAKLSNIKNNIMFWNTINKFRPPKNNENLIDLQTWQSYLFRLQTPVENIAIPIFTERIVDCLDKDIEINEIRRSIKKLKNKKCPGNDCVTNEFIFNLPETTWHLIQKMFNNVLENRSWPRGWNSADIKMLHKKGDKKDPTNYRPIALENCTFKLFTGILNDRIINWTNENNIIPEFQNGFRSARGCIDNIFILKTIIDITIHQKQNNALYAVFVDFKGAFDSVIHSKLWEHLISNKISSKILLLLKEIYSTAEIKIATKVGKTEAVKLEKGLLQGDPLSPTLFNVFTNDIETFLKSRGFHGIRITQDSEILLLAYADDLVLFSKSAIDLRDKLLALEEYCNTKQLTINTDKTKIMIFKKRINKKLHQHFTLNHKQIEIVDTFKYLGITFYRTGSFMHEIKNRVTSTYRALNNLQSIILKGRNVSWSTKVTLIKSMIESVLLYGSEVWGLEDTKKIKSAYAKVYKKLLYLPNNTPNYAVIRETGTEDIELQITKRCLRWWTKILNAPVNSFVYQCYKRLTQDIDSNKNWASIFKNKIFVNELTEIWNRQNTKYNDESWNQIINHYKNSLEDTCNREINKSDSLYWYKHLINNTNTEHNLYLHLNLPTHIINTFCQTRLLNKYIERIYTNHNSYIFKNNENCTICNKQEPDTLLHLLLNCNITNNLRRHDLNTNTIEEIMNLLKTHNKENVLKIVNFINNSLKIRSFILNE